MNNPFRFCRSAILALLLVGSCGVSVCAQQRNGSGGGTGGAGLSNLRLSLTGPATVVDANYGYTIALSGANFYTLSFADPSTYRATFMVQVVNEDDTRGKWISVNGLDNGGFYLWPDQTALVYAQNNVWYVTHPARWKFANTATITTNIYTDFTNGTDTYGSSEGLEGADFTASQNGTVLTVSGVADGALTVGAFVNGVGLTPETITSFGSGTGGSGTYNTSVPQTVVSEPMTATTSASFKTVQKALLWVLNTIDFSGIVGESRFIIHPAANTVDTQSVHFSPHALVGPQGGASLQIVGPADSSATLHPSSGTATIQGYYGLVVELQNLTLISPTGGNCIDAEWGAKIIITGGLVYAQCDIANINSQLNSIVQENGTNTIGTASVANTMKYHVVAGAGGQYTNSGGTISFPINTAWGTVGFSASESAISLIGATFALNGFTITGKRFDINANGSLLTGSDPNTFIPGSVAGTYETGGTSNIPGSNVTWTIPGATGQFATNIATNTLVANIDDNSTLIGTNVSAQYGLYVHPIFKPGGASLASAYGAMFQPQISASSAISPATLNGAGCLLQTLTGYAGTSNGVCFHVLSPAIGAGNNALPFFTAFQADAVTNGNGITSGTVSNTGFIASAFTAAAASGGTINNYGFEIVVSSGSGAGTTTNKGLYILGNGGTGGGGTTTNYAIDDESTAQVLLKGPTTINGAKFVLSGNISSAAWTTAGVRYANIAGTMTDTTSSGTVAAAYTDVFGGNTIAASSAVTYTKYYSMYIKAPVAGTNVTFTNNYALGADSINDVGALAIGGAITAPNLATSSAATTGTLCWTTGTGNVNVDTTAACLASREDMKDIAGPLTGALAETMRLSPIRYAWKPGTPKAGDSGEHIGLGAFATGYVDERLIARDDKGDPRGWRQDALIALLVATVQEQQIEIETLQRRTVKWPFVH